MTTSRRFRGGAFGKQFADEIQRLGVPLSGSDAHRLSGATEDQVLSAVQRLMPATNPQILDLSARRGPQVLARELARSYRAPNSALQALDTANAIDGIAWSLSMLADVLSSIHVA